MIKIYCDDVLINEDYYAGLTRSGQLFSESFKLGATLCEEYKITLDKEGLSEIPSVVKLYEDDVLYKTLMVDDYSDEDTQIILYCMDYMLKANINYDASPLMVETGSTTLKAILDDICQLIGVTNGVYSFIGEDLKVSWYNNEYSARNYIGFIAELNASYAYIDENNSLQFKHFKEDTGIEIDFEELEDFKIGQLHTISRVVWDDGNNKWEVGDTTGDTYYIDTANVYVTTETAVQEIYNLINGFRFYNFKTGNCPINNIKAGNRIVFKNGDVEYPTIAQFTEELEYSGGYWCGGIELDVITGEQEETQVQGMEKVIKHLQTIVDRNTNTITTIVTETVDLREQVTNNSTEINNNYQEIVNRFDSTASVEDLELYQKTMQTQIDANKFEIANIQTAVIDGVEKVITSSGTFDENGLLMQKTGAETSTRVNQIGINVKDSNRNDALFAGYVDDNKAAENKKLESYKGQTIVYSNNMIVENYMTIGKHSRLEDYEDGTGVFYIS